jgi:two-component system, chemotaxis family, sensor kinase CheA
MVDPYRYFRIEARELIDELIVGLTGLAHGEPATGRVGGLLRHTHTLKGAARVVGQTAIADHTHALEGMLEPSRSSTDPVPADQVEEMLGRVDDIADLVRGLDTPVEVTVTPLPPERGPEPAATAADAASAALPSPRAEVSVDVQPENLRTARTSLAEIDAVINGVGQSRNQLSVLRECLALNARTTARPDVDPTLREALDAVARELGTCADRMDRDLRSVYDVAERLRLVPVTSIVPDLEGAARDVAAAQGKRVRLEVGGAQLRLDAPVLEAVQGALRQIVRNAVAHGIEPSADRLAAGKPAGGRIRLDVRQSGGHVVFSCTDDGRGIDIEAVRRELGQAQPGDDQLDDEQVLDRLALGGVSTAEVVSEVSGRGIGLDVVRDAATRLGGKVAIRTRSGQGTTIDLTTQLSLSAQEVLIVDDGALMAVPLAAIRETARVAATEITTGLSGEILRYHGGELPFLPLAAALGDTSCTGVSQPAWSVMIVTGQTGPVAIGARRLVGTATIAIRPLPPMAAISPLISGVWLDVDARARLVLDPQLLAAAAIVRRSITLSVPVPLAPILIVDDSLTTRMLEQSVLEAAGYRVELAASAEEGLAMASRKPYALVLVDVEMPGMDGFSFVEQTRSRPELRYLPCILVTSRASAQDRARGLAAGARAHIDKREFHQGTLLSRIADLLGS